MSLFGSFGVWTFVEFAMRCGSRWGYVLILLIYDRFYDASYLYDGFYDAPYKVRYIKHLGVLIVGSEKYIYCYKYTFRSNG